MRRALLGFFGVAILGERSPPVAEALRSVAPNRGLFPHQKRAASEVERFLYHEDGRAMLHLPTGVGKTRTAMSIVASHLRTRSRGLVLWLAATRELLEQAAEEFELTWSAVGDRQVDCLRYWSHHNPPINEVNDGIVICGLAKLHSYGKERDAAMESWEIARQWSSLMRLTKRLPGPIRISSKPLLLVIRERRFLG